MGVKHDWTIQYSVSVFRMKFFFSTNIAIVKNISFFPYIHNFFDLDILSYLDLEEYHRANGIMREGVVMTAKATQSRM